jgi:CBS domain-containing protein/sporulation protein YlmC with PRC-barrel domain
MYLSQLVGVPVRDSLGDKIGTVKDLIVRPEMSEYPPVTGIVARLGQRDIFIPWEQISHIDDQGAHLRSVRLSLQPFSRRQGEILLVKDVLDRQLVDIEGRRVIRANDLQLIDVNGQYRLVGVDIGAGALLRRVLPRWLAPNVRRNRVIDWKEVEPFASQTPLVKLKVSHEGLARLHPVEIARIAEALAYPQAAEIVESLDDAVAADTIEELPEERQVDIVEALAEERAADILDEMGPDEAADILAELDREKAERILAEMEPEHSAEVRELMAYEEDTAGGLMTTDYVALPGDLTVEEAMLAIRALERKPENLYYIYVIDDPEQEHLRGVVSLRDLILADPQARLSEIAIVDVQHAHPTQSAKDVARTIAEYNLLALPVVDEEDRLLGVVTVDDAIAVLVPESLRERVSRVFG